MPNSLYAAKRWTEFVARRPEVQNGPLILEHFKAGTITRLCDCGCESYDLRVPDKVSIAPLTEATGPGCAFQMIFRTVDPGKTVELMLFTDSRGFLDGIEVDFCANSAPMPASVELLEPPLDVDGVMRA